jgi:hypothetical protein
VKERKKKNKARGKERRTKKFFRAWLAKLRLEQKLMLIFCEIIMAFFCFAARYVNIKSDGLQADWEKYKFSFKSFRQTLLKFLFVLFIS